MRESQSPCTRAVGRKPAGLGTIIRPFDNMRISRSNEVEHRFGAKKESLWIGHSEKVMLKHYHVLKDSDYLEAAGKLDCQISHATLHALLDLLPNPFMLSLR